jgi:hypothetical protein
MAKAKRKSAVKRASAKRPMRKSRSATVVLDETAYLLRSPANARRLLKSIRAANTGRYVV